MTDIPIRVSRELHGSWRWLVLLGALLVIGGLLLLVAPGLGGLLVTTWIAAIFIVGGIVQIIHAVSARGWRSGLWQWLSGLIYVGGGLVIALDPLVGAVALTALLALVFLIDGGFRAALALRARPMDGWGWMLLSGVVSIAVGVYVLFVIGTPPVSLLLLGVLAGVSFVFEGLAFLVLGLLVRRAA